MQTSFISLCAAMVILHLGPFLNMLGRAPGGRVYIVTMVAHLILVVLAAGALARAKSTSGKAFSILDNLTMAYLGWSIISIILYYQDNHPAMLEAYVVGTHIYTVPIFRYFHLQDTLRQKIQQLGLYKYACQSHKLPTLPDDCLDNIKLLI